MVFPTMTLIWVSQGPALATPHGLVCHVDHLQFDPCQHELIVQLPLASSTHWTQLSQRGHPFQGLTR